MEINFISSITFFFNFLYFFDINIGIIEIIDIIIIGFPFPNNDNIDNDISRNRCIPTRRKARQVSQIVFRSRYWNRESRSVGFLVRLESSDELAAVNEKKE